MAGVLIRSAILDGAADLIRAHGARPAQIARSVGIPRSALTDPDLLVNANSVLRFFELAADTCKLPTFGLTLGIRSRLAAIIGPLWVLLRNARTIGEMCSELAENFDLYSDAAMVGIERTSEGVLVNWSATAGRIDSEVQMSEFALCVFANEIRTHLRPDWMPQAVLFRHARPPGKRTPYRTAFGAHVRFNQDRNCLLLDERTWAAPLKSRGSAARALASRVVRLEEEWPSAKRMAHSVEAVVRSLMPYAPCTIDEVSRALDLPARTLQFRLKQQGTSFTKVRDIVRADLASKYLRHSELSASRIAEILGYADVTSLSRSFRRWNGISLRQQRARARGTQ